MQIANNETPDGVQLPNLDETDVLKDLLRAHAMAISQRLAEASHKNVPREEVIMADRRAAAFIASTLLGKNPAYAASTVNTPNFLLKNLRSALIKDLALYEIKAEEVRSDVDFMQFAMFVYTNQVHMLINEIQKNPQTIEQEGARGLKLLLERWLGYLTGCLSH